MTPHMTMLVDEDSAIVSICSVLLSVMREQNTSEMSV